MKKILLFGAGKSATCLIRYLIRETGPRGWALVVAEYNLSLAQSKTGNAPHAKAVGVAVENEAERELLIREADIVISLLPPALHSLVAISCVKCKKDLLTASYLDAPIKSLERAIRENGLLFLGEMGLDPGIDHMSAMQLIHRVRQQDARVLAFRSHTGGLVAPGSDNNPWHYKISWNPRNVVMAGSAGARYKENGQIVSKTYEELFENNGEVAIDGIGQNLSWYPNRDSLPYISLYGLDEAETFIRTTLRYPDFCRGWKSVVRAGLTDDQAVLRRTADGRKGEQIAGREKGGRIALESKDDRAEAPIVAKEPTFAEWSAPILPYVNADNRAQLEFLGLFDNTAIPPQARVSADVLQYLLETKLAMEAQDKDMIVMLHEISYSVNGRLYEDKSSLIVKGENTLETAMAKTVGLPLGIAAKLILEGKMKGLTGLHIPILPEIYEPVLKELAEEGVHFEEKSFH
jgi:saccharopine dehydrogenase-like NADP-dependent oxidoreductase